MSFRDEALDLRLSPQPKDRSPLSCAYAFEDRRVIQGSLIAS